MQEIFEKVLNFKMFKWLKSNFNLKIRYGRYSYSQEGEDMILRRIFGKESKGFYVDVGAHHPKRFSNTYYFYKLGWRGINIDAMPGSMSRFRRIRPKDINLEFTVSEKSREKEYYMFTEPALNTFSLELAEEYKNSRGEDYEILLRKKDQVKSLEEIFEQYLDSNTKISFMSIDVEGLELDVLRSNNWTKYRPEVILVEIFKVKFEDLPKDKIAVFLKRRGYEIFCKTKNTVFFKNTRVDNKS